MITTFDMHSHILPCMDDGSNSVEKSVKMLNALKKQGVKNVCLTPHYYTYRESCDDFLNRRRESFEKLRPNIPDGINVCLGAEVFVTNYFFYNDFNPEVCYGESNHLLVEFNYDSGFRGESLDYLVKLIENFRVVPVIAHIERYPKLLKNNELLRDLKRMGVKYQVNVSSFLSFFPRHRLLKLMNAGMIDFLGTDAHSFERNTPLNFTPAFDIISKKVSPSKISRIEKNCADIFYTIF